MTENILNPIISQTKNTVVSRQSWKSIIQKKFFLIKNNIFKLSNFVFILLFILLISCDELPTPVESNSIFRANHLELGNPSNANMDINTPNNFLIEKLEFALSYNRDLGRANWVSWHLSTDWRGGSGRQNDFRADSDLPGEWYKVDGNDFQNSGFDRGHICPSADRTRTSNINSTTFLMTNIMPQAPDNNRGPWVDLEEYTRDNVLLSGINEAYIMAGSYGIGGIGSRGFVEFLQEGRIAVPSHTWKIIISLPSGINDLARIDENLRVIAVIIPNEQNLDNQNWRSYRTSIDEIEAQTGLDFLSNVPDEIENILESKIDTQ